VDDCAATKVGTAASIASACNALRYESSLSISVPRAFRQLIVADIRIMVSPRFHLLALGLGLGVSRRAVVVVVVKLMPPSYVRAWPVHIVRVEIQLVPIGYPVGVRPSARWNLRAEHEVRLNPIEVVEQLRACARAGTLIDVPPV